jgi:hypothetical protein
VVRGLRGGCPHSYGCRCLRRRGGASARLAYPIACRTLFLPVYAPHRTKRQLARDSGCARHRCCYRAAWQHSADKGAAIHRGTHSRIRCDDHDAPLGCRSDIGASDGAAAHHTRHSNRTISGRAAAQSFPHLHVLVSSVDLGVYGRPVCDLQRMATYPAHGRKSASADIEKIHRTL